MKPDEQSFLRHCTTSHTARSIVQTIGLVLLVGAIFVPRIFAFVLGVIGFAILLAGFIMRPVRQYTCGHCGNAVTEQSRICPVCHVSLVTKQTSDNGWLWFGILLAIAMIALGLSLRH